MEQVVHVPSPPVTLPHEVQVPLEHDLVPLPHELPLHAIEATEASHASHEPPEHRSVPLPHVFVQDLDAVVAEQGPGTPAVQVLVPDG